MFVILLLNVMELLSVVGGDLLEYTMYGLPKNVCVVPADPVSVWMLLPCFVCVFVCRKLSLHLGV